MFTGINRKFCCAVLQFFVIFNSIYFSQNYDFTKFQNIVEVKIIKSFLLDKKGRTEPDFYYSSINSFSFIQKDESPQKIL